MAPLIVSSSETVPSTPKLSPNESDMRSYEDCSDINNCSICFEECRPVPLPCACTMQYCGPCWDRALASSAASRGQARCPSCRTCFTVDFNEVNGSIILGLGTANSSHEDQHMRQVHLCWAPLYEKTRAAQIQRLRSHGSSTCSASINSSAGSCDANLACSVTSSVVVGEHESSSTSTCICGATLERIDTRSRVLRVLTESGIELKGSELDQRITKLAKGGLIRCDLCHKNATTSGHCWSCPNGTQTVFHPAARDICERCFCAYAVPCARNVKLADGFGFCAHVGDRMSSGLRRLSVGIDLSQVMPSRRRHGR